MYADRQLAALATRKRILEARIAVHRMECELASLQLAGPMTFVDRLWAGWRRLSPWVKYLGVPLGFLAARKVVRRGPGQGGFATVLGLLPVVLEIWKGLREPRRGGGDTMPQ